MSFFFLHFWWFNVLHTAVKSFILTAPDVKRLSSKDKFKMSEGFFLCSLSKPNLAVVNPNNPPVADQTYSSGKCLWTAVLESFFLKLKKCQLICSKRPFFANANAKKARNIIPLLWIYLFRSTTKHMKIILKHFFWWSPLGLSLDSHYITSLRVCLCFPKDSWERKCFLSEVSSLFTLGYPSAWPQLWPASLFTVADAAGGTTSSDPETEISELL